MASRGIRAAWLLGVALAAVPPVSAGEENDAEPWRDQGAFDIPPAKLLAAANAVPDPADVPAVELFEDHAYTFDESGRRTSRHRVLYKLLKLDGSERWTTVLRSYDPWYEAKPKIRARVVTPDGVAHDLKDDALIESPFGAAVPMLYTERRMLKAPLPALLPGSVVEIESARTESAPFFDRGTVEKLALQREVPIRGFRASLDWPASLPFRYRVRGMEGAKVVSTTHGSRVQLSLENGPVDGLPDLPRAAPPDAQLLPCLSWSTGASWNAIAKGYAAVVDRQIGKPDLKAWIAPAQKSATDSASLVSALVALLHSEVRYTGIELKDASIVPRSPDETLKRKYGDCKDKATLLVAMLRAAGLKAEVALVASGLDLDPDPDLPGLDAFNHVIVRVEDPALWIDATDEFARPGVLAYGVEGRMSLLAVPESDALARLPRSRAEDNRVVIEREVILAERGPSRVVQTTRGFGISERNQRAQFGGPEPDRARVHYDDVVKKLLHAEKAEDLPSPEPKDLTVPFESHTSFEEASIGLTDAQAAKVVIPFAELAGMLMPMLPPPESRAPRTADFVLPWAMRATTTYRIRPPPGYGSPTLPDPVEGSLGPAVWKLGATPESDGSVTLDLSLDPVRSQWSAAELKAGTSGVTKLAERTPVIVKFPQLGRKALAEGRKSDAIAAFRSLVDLHPQEAMHHSDMATALLECGLGEAAREEARKAVELEPKSAEAYRVMGSVLMSDLVGRLAHPGFDREGAEAAYRKAVELDPSDPRARLGLGGTLAVGDDGTSFGSGARLDAAIAEFSAVRDEMDSSGADDPLMSALFQAAKWDELKRLAPKCHSSTVRDTTWVAAVAASESVGAASAQAAKLEASADGKRLLLIQAGFALAMTRHWPEGAAVLTEAGRGGSLEAHELAFLIGKTKKIENAYPDDRPRRTVAEFLAALASQDAVAAVTKVTAGPPRRPFDDARVRGAREFLLGFGRHEDLPADFPLRALVDLLGSTAEWHLDSDSTGERVQLVFPWSMPIVYSFYTVTSAGQTKVFAVNSEPEMLGEEAMRRLAAGDVAGAARRLRWAADAFPIMPDGDPLSVPPFLLFWGDNPPTSAEQLRFAAAALAASGPGAAEALPILEEGAARAKQPQETMRFDRAISEALESLGRWDALVPVTVRLRSTFPSSKKAFFYQVDALFEQKKWDDVEALIAGGSGADSAMILDTKIRLAGRRGNWAQVVALLRDGMDDKKTDPWKLNQLAWAELMTGMTNERTLTIAQRATEPEFPTAASLHTLASVQAELGRPEEARETIVKELEVARVREPKPDDWYVLGRIAEDYGESSAALKAYQRVLDGPATSDCVVLARARMHAIDEQQKKAAAAAAAATATSPASSARSSKP